MKRSKFNLTHMHSTTLDAGYLVPFFLQETLPNDTFYLGMNSFVRCQPMLAPLMHKVNLYTQYWYCPNRILWDNWEAFITGGDSLNNEFEFPVIQAPAGDGFLVGSLGDYFGFPVNQEKIEVSALPFRALVEIWNTRYRDEDLQQELPISYDDGLDETTSTDLLTPCWKKDYFTLSRGSTQRGQVISVPTNSFSSNGANASVEVQINSISGLSLTKRSANPVTPNQSEYCYSGNINSWFWFTVDSISLDVSAANASKIQFAGNSQHTLNFTFAITDDDAHGVSFTATNEYGFKAVGSYNTRFVNKRSAKISSYTFKVNVTLGKITAAAAEATAIQYIYPNQSTLITYKTSGFSGSITVQDLRLASASQRYAENSLKYGNRYEEFIKREFGIKPRDARIQRPEYLGGSKSVLQISEVLQTAEGNNTGVGTMRGHGVASMRQRPIKFTSPEHGIIIGLMSIRPEPVYTQGIHKEWLKRDRLDFFTPEFAHVGMQEIRQQELYATKDNKDVIFGFTDRYQEYRYRAPKVTAQFRDTTYNYWNMAEDFKQAPFISADFVDMKRSLETFKRPFVSKKEHAYLAMLRNNVIAVRPIPKRAKNILK